ncbi:NADPH-dependent FMN reductase [Streptomyces hoynatensis]|nr:NAD(P)H-dependent oxidoreductase [Streptomyces hoynatensis]
MSEGNGAPGGREFRLLAVPGSTARESQTARAARAVLERAGSARPGVRGTCLGPEALRLPAMEVDARASGALARRPAVRAVCAEVARADALVLATPVYQGSFSGALKNLLDHLPMGAFQGKPALVVSVAAKVQGAHGAVDHLQAVVRALGGWPVPTSVVCAGGDFPADGAPAPEVLRRVDTAIGELLGFRLAGRGPGQAPAPPAPAPAGAAPGPRWAGVVEGG